ncbi:tetraspanin-7 isoform X2 [Beta vulgaris subsp. vulgaris]|nr:tetraspanin-7 isoform X2 [Beta vulgaris subsp. vulgaris]
MPSIRPKDLENLSGDQICYLFCFVVEYTNIGFAILFGAMLLTKLSAGCFGFRFLGMSLILMGVALLILCYISCSLTRHVELGLAKMACCTFPLLVAMAALGIFALAVSTKGGGKSIPGRSYKEYHVESYSHWMVKKVNDTNNWENYYKKAVIKGRVCNAFFNQYQLDKLDEFYQRPLDAFEWGCCKPPEECNFNYTSPAKWIKPEIGNYSNNDCNRWDNDPNILCFNCQSCKAAFLQDLKHHWFTTG